MGSSICFLSKQIKMEEEQEYEDQEDETQDRSEFFLRSHLFITQITKQWVKASCNLVYPKQLKMT